MTENVRPAQYKSQSLLNTGLLGIAALLSAVFFFLIAAPYLMFDAGALSLYDGKTFWIVSHVFTGSIALFIGAPQLWMGLTGRTGTLHHRLGWSYLAMIALSSVAAFYLAVTTQVSWLFGMGLGGLGLAWVLTGSLALIAILKRNFSQHMEWMIRSYVVTLGFVFFRIFVGVTEANGVGTLAERLIAASWICWALPLLITEVVMQGRKIFAPRKVTRQ